jgi:hypothetical protein
LKDDLLFFGEFRPTKCFERCQWGYAAAIPYPHFESPIETNADRAPPLLDGVSLPQFNMSLARGHGIDLGQKDSSLSRPDPVHPLRSAAMPLPGRPEPPQGAELLSWAARLEAGCSNRWIASRRSGRGPARQPGRGPADGHLTVAGPHPRRRGLSVRLGGRPATAGRTEGPLPPTPGCAFESRHLPAFGFGPGRGGLRAICLIALAPRTTTTRAAYFGRSKGRYG